MVITDVNDYRLGLAQKMGATRAINVTREKLDDVMKELGMQEGFDVGLEMSGNPTAFRDMLRTMHHGGSVALLGIPPGDTAIDWNQVIFKGLNMRGIYGREMFETWYKMAALLQAGLDITPVITHHFPIQEFQQRLRDHGIGSVGQGHPRLVHAELDATAPLRRRRSGAQRLADVAEAIGVAVVARVHARPARRARAAAARARATPAAAARALATSPTKFFANQT